MRAVEKQDAKFLYLLENDESMWKISHTQEPFSMDTIWQFIKNNQRDIYKTKQLRLAICKTEHQLVGFVDLFNFNPQHRRAEIGIAIFPTHRKQGLATETLQMMLNYSKTFLNLHQLYVEILESNQASIRLFKKIGFEECGLKKDWILHNGIFENIKCYQYIIN